MADKLYTLELDGTAEKLRAEYGHWGEHPEYSVSDWVHAVGEGDTRLGYWEWVEVQLDSKEDEE